MGRPVLYAAPTSEPITLDEAKAHLNVTGSSKDAYINTLIIVARKSVERYLQRALITQTWDLYMQCWHSCIEIPYAPLVSISAVTYKDTNGDEQTLTISDFAHVVTSDTPGRLVQKYDVVYPEVELGNPEAIKIRYVAGYGAASAVPEEIRHAIKLILTDLYEHRGTKVVGTIVQEIKGHITDLIHSYKVYEF